MAAILRAEVELPDLGDTSSVMISPAQEKILGERWQRAYRSQVATSNDPLIIDYLEKLFNRLLPHSQLAEKKVDLIVAENKTLNAFAVPGNVIGIHTGLLTYAKTENQLATVISHEMAHLSQRHYARHLEQRKNMTMPILAGMLAGLVLAANSDSDAGVATIMTTQAAALQKSLAFSRQNEQEADRIGMQTMLDAGLDPHAAGDMFEEMVRANRLNRRPPEYLLTHPVSESRVADARNRAMQYPRKPTTDDLEFQLVRTRVRVAQEETPQIAVKVFRGELKRGDDNQEASRYGLVVALTQASQFDEARTEAMPLLEKNPNLITYQIMRADIEIAAERFKTALEIIQPLKEKFPDNYPLTIRHAETLMKAGLYEEAATLLDLYSRKRTKDDYVWYLLAEVNGLAGNILGVHQARAEYFILNGIYDKAQIQLRNALKLTKDSSYKTALIEERLKYVEALMLEKSF
jgi:beta-barrel assembly-enhancing protease